MPRTLSRYLLALLDAEDAPVAVSFYVPALQAAGY